MSRPTFLLLLAGALAAAPVAAQPPAPGGAPRPRDERVERPRRERVRQLGPADGQRVGPRRQMGIGPMAGPMGQPGGRGGRGVGVSQLLARSGELRLTDQQVVRLAGIARRETDRRQGLRARIDSLRSAGRATGAPGAAAPRRDPSALRAEVQRIREQSHADLRDAIAVLTPDQQDRAWEMNARRGGTARGMRAGRMDGGPGRVGPGAMGPRGMRPGAMRPGAMRPGMTGPGARRPNELRPTRVRPNDMRRDLVPADPLRPGRTLPVRPNDGGMGRP